MLLMLQEKKVIKEFELNDKKRKLEEIDTELYINEANLNRINNIKKGYLSFDSDYRYDSIVVLSKLSNYNVVELSNMRNSKIIKISNLISEEIILKIRSLNSEKERLESDILLLENQIKLIKELIKELLNNADDRKLADMETSILEYMVMKHNLNNYNEIKVNDPIDYRDVPRVKINRK